jgi:lysophospholipase L1-like esterase
MHRFVLILALACTAATVACGGGDKGPIGPTPQPRISRTRFLAFGDSFTAGEVTTPIGSQLGSGESGVGTLIRKQIVVPTASYPSQLQTQLRITYASQGAAITVLNSGEPSERILDGAQRFPGVFDANRPEVVLLQEGANGLPLVGPDISTGVMRIMVQAAKNGGARVFVGSMIPQVAGRPRATTPVSETLAYNNTLQIMSTQESVTYVDLYNPMLAEAATLIGSDGLHPTEAGYRRIAELFFAAVKRELEVP